LLLIFIHALFVVSDFTYAHSIPGGVIEIRHGHNPPGLTMALQFTQPPTEISTSNVSWAGALD
jgi:hypothetical protein